MLLAILSPLRLFAQTELQIALAIAPGDTDRFWVQIPSGYSADHPPALLIWWHQLGGSQFEMRDYSNYDGLANARGWIAASHFGPNDRHWNVAQTQNHCQVMMDWLRDNGYPFSVDSIYMIGGSMGGAAGQVWNNNHCGIHDYMAAASAGGSQILDCQLRQEQYLAGIGVDAPDTNRSMRAAFGGLPADSAAVAFAYHRASAIHLADTSQSMHFNSLNLPVFNTWGHTLAESLAYGEPAAQWDLLRRASGADSTLDSCSGIAGHGVNIMNADSVVSWLSHFRRNPFPEELSINADNSDEYYWTRVELRDSLHTFGRYGVWRNVDQRRVDITLVRNIRRIEIECQFPWPWDSLCGNWINLDSANTSETTILFTGIPWSGVFPVSVTCNGESLAVVRPTLDALEIRPAHGGYYCVRFAPLSVPATRDPLPGDLRLLTAYPNPFNAQLSLQIESRVAGLREIQLYDISGRLAKTLTVAVAPGLQRTALSADGLATGIYFVRLSGSTQPPLKIVLLK
jgi:hypothetical protein